MNPFPTAAIQSLFSVLSERELEEGYRRAVDTGTSEFVVPESMFHRSLSLLGLVRFAVAERAMDSE